MLLLRRTELPLWLLSWMWASCSRYESWIAYLGMESLQVFQGSIHGTPQIDDAWFKDDRVVFI